MLLLVLVKSFVNQNRVIYITDVKSLPSAVGLLKLADTSLILINPSPSNVKNLINYELP